jgi:diguanylate cyclase (GGDEF)-like protein
VTDRLLVIEQHEADVDHQRGDNAFGTSLLVIGLAVGIELLLGALLAWFLARRMLPRALAPEEAQAKFAEAMQVAASEDAGHHMLQRYLTRSIKGSRVAILAIDNDTNELEAISAPDGISDEILQTEGRRCLAVSTARAHSEAGDPDQLVTCDICTVNSGFSVCTPLLISGEVVGSVLVDRDDPLDLDDERRIRDSILQATPVLANLRNLAAAETQAATDSLTGLPNKGSIEATFRQLVAQAQRSSTSLAVLGADLDHFKNVNDTHGHLIGSKLLAEVGQMVKSACRRIDFAFRYGGDEFVIVLPQASRENAYVVARRLHRMIGETTWLEAEGLDIHFTASIGVASYPSDAKSKVELLHMADEAMYLVKNTTRNGVAAAKIGALPAA